MVEKLKDMGLQKHWQKLLCSDSEYLIDQPYPLVVKPVNSACSDNVTLVENDVQLKEAVTKIFKSGTNKLLLPVTSVVVQRFIGGEEYVVNSITFEGVTKTMSFAKYTKLVEGGIFKYIFHSKLPINSAVGLKLRYYANQVISALGIMYGPTHLEIKLSENQTPYLIDFGARLQGYSYSLMKAGCPNPFDLTVSSFTDGKHFCNYIENDDGPHYIIYWISCSKDGTFRGLNPAILSELSSKYCIEYTASVGGKVRKTVDQTSVIGTITIYGQNEAQVERDAHFLHGNNERLVFIE